MCDLNSEDRLAIVNSVESHLPSIHIRLKDKNIGHVYGERKVVQDLAKNNEKSRNRVSQFY